MKPFWISIQKGKKLNGGAIRAVETRVAFASGSGCCLLYTSAHEIAEYVYAENSLNNLLQPEAEVALQGVLGQEYESRDKTQKSSCIDTVLGWAKELFCDLFAVQLIGPSYTLAYVELFDLPNLLDRGGSVAISTARPPMRFYDKHPSHPFRVKHQRCV